VTGVVGEDESLIHKDKKSRETLKLINQESILSMLFRYGCI
jgi:hypothetical protein